MLCIQISIFVKECIIAIIVDCLWDFFDYQDLSRCACHILGPRHGRAHSETPCRWRDVILFRPRPLTKAGPHYPKASFRRGL